MTTIPVTSTSDRLGFHYYLDTQHYLESDLRTWLPELESLGAKWLTLIAPNNHAIPEPFLRGLMEAEIEPIIHFHLPLEQPSNVDTLHLLFSTYAKWGIQYIVLFDRPNVRSVWSSTTWAQSDLVERFLDIYLPLSNMAIDTGLIPVFPPLEPGGDYWDTAFLRAALQSILRRGQTQLIDSLLLSAYAWADTQQLNWGAGGPERWPSARPYFTPTGQQDQRGFYIFDWYLAVTQAILTNPRPIILVGSGSRLNMTNNHVTSQVDVINHAQRNLAIAQRLFDERGNNMQKPFSLEPISPHVLACNFWLLVADPKSPHANQAWFLPDGSALPVVDALRQWISDRKSGEWLRTPVLPTETKNYTTTPFNRPIAHYLLLPLYEWGVAEWHLEVIRPFVTKYHPTIGFSLTEAAQATRVTVVGGKQSFSEESINNLQDAGCKVEEITGDGTSIATQLATI